MHKPPHSVSPAFRSRFAVEWNAELAISKRVIGIFRLRFACLQNSPFQRILTAETQRTRGCKTPETDTGCRRFRIKGSFPNGRVSTRFAPRLCVSAVKLLAYFQRALETNEPNGPRVVRIAQIIVQTNTNLRETLNFPLLA